MNALTKLALLGLWGGRCYLQNVGADEMQRLGRYLLADELGRGGMATVCLAVRTGTAGIDRLVAIKRLRRDEEATGDRLAMLLDEAQLMARMHHGCVLGVDEVALVEGEPIVVFPFYPSLSLAEILREHDAGLPPAVVARIAVDALAGLQHAHAATDKQGEPLAIVHRDISPSNLLVGRDGMTRVIDFGIAVAAKRLQTTEHGVRKGKRAYMAPEQLVLDDVDARTDLFAVGVVLAKMLRGIDPFPRDEIKERLAAIKKGLELPQESALWSATLAALAYEKRDRPDSAQAMATLVLRAEEVAEHGAVAHWLEQHCPDGLAALNEKMARANRHGLDMEEEPTDTHGVTASEPKPSVGSARRVLPVILFLVLGGLLGFGSALGLELTSARPQLGRVPESTIHGELQRWLGEQRGGYCAAEPGQVVVLCASEEPEHTDPNGNSNFCFEASRKGRASLRRNYPRGLTVDVGLHYDGARGGNILTFGTSRGLSYACDPKTPGDRIELRVNEAGQLEASAPFASLLRTQGLLSVGSHLIEFRYGLQMHALYLDGNLVMAGRGTQGREVRIHERWAPGLVLGESNQRWWSCNKGSNRAWLKIAPFLFHLRDDVAKSSEFSLQAATQAGRATILLFDSAGVAGPLWYPSHNVDEASLDEPSRKQRAGRARGATWVTRVWEDCFTGDGSG